MSNTKSKAVREFEILEEAVDKPIILPFKSEILALVDKFGDSGQSGGSAPLTAGAISQAVKTLCMQEPICGITGNDDEWSNRISGDETYQNIRCSAVFKKGKGGRPYYLNAIVFRGEGNGNSFTSNGSVTLKNGEKIKSRQYINLPFKPKTFYVDVTETEWADKEEKVKKVGGGWWTSVVKDEKQLEEVFKYYKKK